MTGTKVKFTKRLSVRLAAVCCVVVLGAIAIAQGQLVGGRSDRDADASPPEAPASEADAGMRPIPMPEDEPSPATADAAVPRSRFASLPEMPDAPVRSKPALRSADPDFRHGEADELPSPWELAMTAPPAFDRPDAAAAEVPERPPLDRPARDDSSVYAAPSPPPAPLAAPASWSAEPPRELPPEPTRSALADAGGSLYVRAQAETTEEPDAAWSASAASGEPAELAPPVERPLPENGPAAAEEPPSFASRSAYDPAVPSFDTLPAAPVATAAAPQAPEPELLEPSPRGSFAPLADSSSSGGAAGFDGDGAPGAEALEGRQAPSLTIEKIAPPEIQVGKEAGFELRIRNVGQVAAHDLIVLDRVPRGTRFVNARPQMTLAPDGQLMWQLGTLQPGDETTVMMNVLPVAEGEIGSVAQVLFQTHASARTICTRPQLTVKHTGPQKVLIGEAVLLDITVANSGTGAATGIVLVEDVPEGLVHSAGRELEYEVGTLQPGESRRLQLTLRADKAGVIENSLIVRGDGNLIARDSIQMEIVAPDLQVSLSGPRMRYLQREAVYEVSVTNPGTAIARGVELVTYLPKGMKFLAADRRGQYEPQNHAVYWSLVELPPRETGVAKLTLLPLESGEQKLSVEGRAELGVKHATEKIVQVDTIAELHFSVTDEADPIEIGSETTYIISLSNTGSSAATNIQLSVNMPPELKPVGGDGPTKIAIDGPRVTIDPLAHLAPGERAQYRLRVRGMGAGPQRFQVQLITAETPVPVTKEEITRVYADR